MVAVSVAAVVVVIPVSALIFATIALFIYREALINISLLKVLWCVLNLSGQSKNKGRVPFFKVYIIILMYLHFQAKRRTNNSMVSMQECS